MIINNSGSKKLVNFFLRKLYICCLYIFVLIFYGFIKPGIAQNIDGEIQKLYSEAKTTSDSQEKQILLQEVLHRQPKFNEARLELAKTFIVAEQYKQSIVQLDSILNIDRKIPEVWFQKGIAHLKLRELTAARKSLFRAVQLREDIPQYHIFYGQALFEEEKFDEAVVSFETALSRAKLNQQQDQEAQANFWIGRIHQEKSRFAEAEKYYELALQSNSDLDEARSYLSQITTKRPIIDFSSGITWIVIIVFIIIITILFIGIYTGKIKLFQTVTKTVILPADAFKPDLSRFKLQEKLGDGSMGYVYKAYDEKLKRTVALKIIKLEDTADDDEVKERISRFQREAKTIANLNHPNIVFLYDYYEKDDEYYHMIMEYIDGYSLREILDKKKDLNLKTTVNYIKQMCLALDYAHQNDILHRDIKPANIMINKDGNVKILDFGLAKIQALANVTLLTITGMIVGTPMYMAPEQFQSTDSDVRADIYSLGVVFYEMVTGKKPFTLTENESFYKLFYSIMHNIPPKPGSIRPDLPSTVNTMIEKMLAKNPAHRYQSANEIFDELDSLKIDN